MVYVPFAVAELALVVAIFVVVQWVRVRLLRAGHGKLVGIVMPTATFIALAVTMSSLVTMQWWQASLMLVALVYTCISIYVIYTIYDQVFSAEEKAAAVSVEDAPKGTKL